MCYKGKSVFLLLKHAAVKDLNEEMISEDVIILWNCNVIPTNM